MTTRWILAAFHLLALAIGLGAVWARGRALRRLPTEPDELRRALYADAWWEFALLVWIVTGVFRLLAGTEQDTASYFHNGLFHVKMGLLAVILLLEVRTMAIHNRWRIQLSRGEHPDLSPARTFARISVVEALLVVVMVFLATAMARGMGG